MKKNDIINVSLFVVYKALIEFIYVQVLNPRYEYMGLSLYINVIKIIESYIILLLIYFLLDKAKEKASAIFLQIIFSLGIVPVLAIYGLKNESREAMYMSVGAFAITAVLVRFFPKIKNPSLIVILIAAILFAYSIFENSISGAISMFGIFVMIIIMVVLVSGVKLPEMRNNKSVFFVVLAGLSLVTYALLIKDNGLPSLSAFNFNMTYEVRDKIVYNALTSYIIPWQANVINIFLIALFYLKKNYAKMSFFFFLQILLFSITAHKSYLFSPIAVIVLFYIIEKRNFLRTMISGFVFLNFTAYVTYILNITPWVIALITHRLHFMPAQISYYFFDFFSKNQQLQFSEGLIGKIFGIHSPYQVKAFNLIGETFFNNPNMNANTWYIADAYSNGGVYGLFIISILFAITLIVIDSVTKNYKITIAALFMPMFSLLNGSLLTTFFTSGLLIGIVVISLYSNSDYLDKVVRRKILIIFVKKKNQVLSYQSTKEIRK